MRLAKRLVAVGIVGFLLGVMAGPAPLQANCYELMQGKIRHTVKPIRFEEIAENLDLLRTGDVVGRAVIKY